MQSLGRCCKFLSVILILPALLAHTQQPRQPLVRHVHPVVSSGLAKPLSSLPSTQRMNFSIVLPLRNQKLLTAFLNRLYDPSSPDYRHFLSVTEFTDQYAPSAQDYQAVVDFARARGFTVTASPANRLVVPISGTVDQIQRAFNVSMKLYQHPTENRTFFSPDREPSVPSSLNVAHIAGLNNYSLPQSMAVREDTAHAFSSASIQGSGPGGSYLSSDMRAAYYGGAALTGSGQTVALLQFDGYNIGDVVSSFDGAASATASGGNYVLTYTPITGGTTYTIPIENVLVDGATGKPGQFYPPANDAEQVLDIVQAVGMAPGLSHVRVYIGNSDADILNAMASDTQNLAKQISISWAWYPDDPTTDDVFFEEFAAQGQSVFVASGDYGAYSPSVPYYYPAEDAWVTAVGGTTLATNGAAGALIAETAWDQSGGGISPDGIPFPTWQAGVANSSNGASSTLRNIPDVAMEADFDNYDCNMGGCAGGWAGTSFAAPRWAGFIALVNQQAAAALDPPLGFLNPWIYSTGASSSYGSDFHDIAVGKNNFEPGYGFYAVPGYDLVTGWGSPAGVNLINGMAPKASVGFQLSTSASSLTIDPGSSGTTTIAVIDQGGFAGGVNLSVTSSLPTGITASFSTNPTTRSSVLTISAGISVVTQCYLVTITGTSGSHSATTYVTVDTPSNAVVITSPAMPQVPVTAQMFKPGTPISIQGTALGNPQNISVQWAAGIAPTTGWSTSGITLNHPLTAPFLNQPIATWNTSSIVSAGYYTVQLSATYPSATLTSNTLVYLEPDLFSANWPRWLDITPSTYSGVVPVIDKSGNTELGVMEPTYMGSTAQPRYRVFSLDGSSDQSTNLASGSYLNPAFGNLIAGDSGESVVVDAPDLDVLRADGTSYTLTQGPEHVWYNMAQVQLADLKGDSSLATVVLGIQNWNDLAFVYAWGPDGQLLNSNFPIQVPYTNEASMNSEDPGLVVGDIDGDGKQEIIVQESTSPTSFTFGLFANDGTPRSWAPPTFPGTLGQIILADLDHNGKLETILVAMPNASFHNMLHVLEPDGTERSGWPLDIGSGYIFLAAGDLARTGYDQIVAATHDNLFVLNSDGTTFSSAWPLPTSSFNPFGPVVLADIDGDGYPEILTTTAGYSLSESSLQGSTVVHSLSPSGSNVRSAVQVQTSTPDDTSAPAYFAPTLHAYRRDGSISRSWKILGMHGEQPFYLPRLTVGDFNHDGKTEIAIVNGMIDGGGVNGCVSEGTLEVLATGAPYNPAANDWPMLSHDAHNSAATASANPVTPRAASPVFAPVAGTYSTAQRVTLSDVAAGATIYFTTDGSTPTTSSSVYSTSIAVASTETIKAITVATGYAESLVAAAPYTITVPAAAPSFTPPPATYTTAQVVTITSATPSAAIYYTTDGTTPTTSSSLYKAPLAVSISETLKAVATALGDSTSSITSAAYIITPVTATPVFTPPAATYATTQTVAISSTTPSASIYYTTNGSTPTTGSPLYKTPITVSTSETLQAIATAPGNSVSPIASASYTITSPPAVVSTISGLSPAFASAGGTSFSLTISGSGFVSGSLIYWGTTSLSTQFVSAT
ncbi:MAG: chitobiase/beta-hexosaminidase C-terminal domain-containing protein, partial [Terracidiphilus sp.]